MKRRFLSLMLIAGLVFSFSLPHAFSEFAANQKYLVQASGYLIGQQNIYDSTIAAQISTGAASGSNMFGTLENALVTIGDTNYLNTGTWQSTFLRDGKYFVLQGDAQSQSGDVIHVNIFGRIIDSNPSGSLFLITGKITGTETFKVSYSAKVSSLSAGPVTQPTTTTTGQPSQIVQISIVPGAHNIDNQQFYSPSYLKISPGTTIVWINNDSVPHRITSGTASATILDTTPKFVADGKIDSGIIAPGKSFQYTITSFDTRALSSSLAKYLNLDPSQTAGDITFFDQNYTWMIGVLAPNIPTVTQTSNAQVTILNGASNSANFPFLSAASVQIVAGSTVTWYNNDAVSHRIQSGQIQQTTKGSGGAFSSVNAPLFTADGRIDSGTIAPGQKYTVTLTGTGSTQFFDPNYSWINGVIVSTYQPITIQAPVKISIQPGSSVRQGTATQQFNQYNNYYTPSDIQIVPGTPIIWTNDDTIAHKIYSGVSTQRNDIPFVPDGKIVSNNIAPGASYQVIVNETGIIRFYDPNYTWMNGVIVSVPPSASRVIAAPSMNPGLH